MVLRLFQGPDTRLETPGGATRSLSPSTPSVRQSHGIENSRTTTFSLPGKVRKGHHIQGPPHSRFHEVAPTPAASMARHLSVTRGQYWPALFFHLVHFPMRYPLVLVNEIGIAEDRRMISRGSQKMPSMAFFSSQRENAISALLTFSNLYRDRKGWDILVPLGHLDCFEIPSSSSSMAKNDLGIGIIDQDQ